MRFGAFYAAAERAPRGAGRESPKPARYRATFYSGVSKETWTWLWAGR